MKKSNQHPTGQRWLALAKNHGSTSETVLGALKFIRANGLHFSAPATKLADPKIHKILDHAAVGDAIQLTRGTTTGYRWSTVPDAGAADRAAESIGRRGQRSNVQHGRPQIYGTAHQARWETINYKGQFKGYTGHDLFWDYQSAVGISRSGKSAILVRECKLIRRILAPSGMTFDSDQNGILLRRSDGMDYHPTPADWSRRDFASHCRAQLAKNFKARAEARKLAAVSARFAAVRAREIGSVRVTLDDSRRAGNCVEGSLRYAESRLGIERSEILGAGYLFSVPASRLISSNGHPGVARAVEFAWSRETSVQI